MKPIDQPLLCRIVHVCFSSADLQRTEDYYRDVFGAEVVHEYVNDAGERYGYFLKLAPHTFLEFFRLREEPHQGTMFRHMCFEVSDLESVVAHLATKGIAAEITRSRSDKTRQTWIIDPDGNKLEFHEYDSESLLWARRT